MSIAREVAKVVDAKQAASLRVVLKLAALKAQERRFTGQPLTGFGALA